MRHIPGAANDGEGENEHRDERHLVTEWGQTRKRRAETYPACLSFAGSIVMFGETAAMLHPGLALLALLCGDERNQSEGKAEERPVALETS